MRRQTILGRAYAPTTTYFDPTFSVRAVQARTNSAGAAVDDLSGEEDRLIQAILTGGVIGANSFQVVQRGAGANMSVDVGSGSAKTDLAVVAGTDPGQGNYLARLDDTVDNLTIEASDGSNPRIDQVYLVVLDDSYDGTSRGLPRLAVRKGDPAASPVAPGVDAGWTASLLLASVAVGAGVTSIVTANITDERDTAGLVLDTVGGVSISGLEDEAQLPASDSATYLDLNTSTLTTSFVSIAGTTFTPPAHWNTYKLSAVGTMVAGGLFSAHQLEMRIDIGGTNGTTSTLPGSALANSGDTERGYMTMVATQTRTGLSGAVSVDIEARESNAALDGLVQGYKTLTMHAHRTS